MSGGPRYGWLQRAEALGRAAETALLSVLLLSLIVLAFGQIVLRNIFSTGIAWADGGAQMLVLWIAVIGALAATRDRRHIRIDIASRLLSPAKERWVRIIVDAFAAIVSGVFAWQALRFVVDSRDFGDVLLGGVPAWPLQAVLPAGFVLIAYRFLIDALVAATIRR